jgi:hypothetical protein
MEYACKQGASAYPVKQATVPGIKNVAENNNQSA